MSKKHELWVINGDVEGFADAKKGWTAALKDFAPLVVMDDLALSASIGASTAVLDKLREDGLRMNIRPTGDKWTVTLEPAATSPRSLSKTYFDAFTASARMYANGRPDEGSLLQDVAANLFDLLSPDIQKAYTDKAMDPTFAPKNSNID